MKNIYRYATAVIISFTPLFGAELPHPQPNWMINAINARLVEIHAGTGKLLYTLSNAFSPTAINQQLALDIAKIYIQEYIQITTCCSDQNNTNPLHYAMLTPQFPLDLLECLISKMKAENPQNFNTNYLHGESKAHGTPLESALRQFGTLGETEKEVTLKKIACLVDKHGAGYDHITDPEHLKVIKQALAQQKA
ncbi:MAG: hypothetical protein H6679_04400 [Epsilonproteobacteria bacterium]|nr:hypothetical protein [Campylobacterota bacterium]